MSKSKMTVGQAVVKFLNQQYIEYDGKVEPFVDGVFTIFGHGMVVGLGQALDEDPGRLRVYQGRNEQGMAHAAISYAKQHNRRKIIACSSSIGPGAANMVTAALTATINNIPLLLFPSDTFATRQPDPVLQQLESPADLSITASDCFKPVAKYWDRVSRPEQLMSALVNAMRVLTDTANCGTAVISLPQDVQGESFEYPDYFFQKRVHHISRRCADEYELEQAVELIKAAKKPMLISGGGVRYSEAGETVMEFCKAFNIPVSQTQAGHSALPDSFELSVGGVGVTGGLAANALCKDCDLIIGVGTRFNDFVTG
ncbi:MAG: thiamine pyrophosphate-binding protein, partial [Eubacteriales bacterium]|nr:thiamine pyrophosphate-binding protein [Eubacteriales bacterium]